MVRILKINIFPYILIYIFAKRDILFRISPSKQKGLQFCDLQEATEHYILVCLTIHLTIRPFFQKKYFGLIFSLLYLIICFALPLRIFVLLLCSQDIFCTVLKYVTLHFSQLKKKLTILTRVC